MMRKFLVAVCLPDNKEDIYIERHEVDCKFELEDSEGIIRENVKARGFLFMGMQLESATKRFIRILVQ